MRYEHWDVILFPRESLIPIQEFKTACYVTHDEYGRKLPTLTCYVVSLPASTPFKVSFHSWIPKPKPSALIELQRKGNQRVVYTIHVLIDGTRVLHDFFEVSSKWPIEIGELSRNYCIWFEGYDSTSKRFFTAIDDLRQHADPTIEGEKRSITPDRQSSQRKSSLEFPPFRQTLLMRSCWDAREKLGRIKIFLAEQLVSKSSTGTDVEWGHKNEIVCFSFEHAPRDILEQAGISWPIRNPLYLPGATDVHFRSLENPAPHNKPTSWASAGRNSPSTRQSTEQPRPANPEPPVRPKSNPFPEPFKFPQPPPRGSFKRLRTGIWDSLGSSSIHNDAFDDASMVDTNWSTRGTSSSFTGDVSMPDVLIASPPSKSTGSHPSSTKERPRQYNATWEGRWTKDHKEDQPLAMALRDDRFGALIEDISPPKKGHGTGHIHHGEHQHAAHASFGAFLPPVSIPSKMGPPSGPIHPRPSAASLARKASYSNFSPHLREVSNTVSQNYRNTPKESLKPPSMYHASFPSSKENRVPTPYPMDMRISSPRSYLTGSIPPSHYPKYPPWESDIEMRDPSSLSSSLSRADKISQHSSSGLLPGKSSPVLLPSASGNIKSRKEGLAMVPPLSTETAFRHDKSLLPQVGQVGPGSKTPLYISLEDRAQPAQPSQNSLNITGNASRPSSDHDQPAVENSGSVEGNLREHEDFVPGHRSAMDSLERIEGVLYSALGEEFRNDNVTTTGGGEVPSLEGFHDSADSDKRVDRGAEGGEEREGVGMEMGREGNESVGEKGADEMGF